MAPLRATYKAGKAPLLATYQEGVDSLWARLGADVTGDKLAEWIVANCSSRKEGALIVLAALPATLEELDTLAKANHWCEVWDKLKEKALKAGVVE